MPDSKPTENRKHDVFPKKFAQLPLVTSVHLPISIPSSSIKKSIADRVPLARRQDRAVRAERLAQDRQLLFHRQTATPAHHRDLTTHKITHMTGHKSTRSRRSHILAYRHSLHRAAISTAERHPASWLHTMLTVIRQRFAASRSVLRDNYDQSSRDIRILSGVVRAKRAISIRLIATSFRKSLEASPIRSVI